MIGFLIDLAGILALAVFVTQVVIPLGRGTRLWPAFRRRAKLREISGLRDDLEASELTREAIRLRKRRERERAMLEKTEPITHEGDTP